MSPLIVEPCDPADPARTPTLTLDAGRHLVSAAPGIDTGVQLDRLVLASDAGGTAGSVADGRVTDRPSAPPTPHVDVVHDGRTRIRVHVDGADEPFWLVLGQSENAGWHATTDGAALGPRRLVDGFANGWHVDPKTRSFDVVLQWTPAARRVGVTVDLTARRSRMPRHHRVHVVEAKGRARARDRTRPGRLACRARVAGCRRVACARRSHAGMGADRVRAGGRPHRRAVDRRAGRCRRGRRAAGGGRCDCSSRSRAAFLLAGAGLYIAFAQVRYQTPPIFEWPTVFPRARTMAWLALVFLGAAVVVDLVRRRAFSRRENRSGERS